MAVNQSTQKVWKKPPVFQGDFDAKPVVRKQLLGGVATKAIKVGVFLILGMLLITGNFLLEGRLSNENPVIEQKISTNTEEEVVKIADRSMINLEKGSKYTIEEIDENDFMFTLERGRMWGDFSISDIDFNINIDNKIAVIPNHAKFDLSVKNQTVDLNVYDGDVYLGFVESGLNLDKVVAPYDSLLMNQFLVPRDTQVNFPISKISENIRPLLYSKLTKELRLGAIPESDSSSNWVKTNTIEDSKFEESVRQDVDSDIRYGGRGVDDGLFAALVFWSEENLAFVPEKKNAIIYDHLFSYIDDAIFAASEGDEALMNEMFVAFHSYAGLLPAEIIQGEQYDQIFDTYVDRLFIFSVDDMRSEVLIELLDTKFAEGRELEEVIDNLWVNVYRSMDVSELEAGKALGMYYKYLSKMFGGDVNDDRYKSFVSSQNQLFDNLLLRNSLFYTEANFEMKSELEAEFLRLYEGTFLGGEISQDLISDKIAFLKKLQVYFFEDEIAVSEAKNIILFLIEEIDELMVVESEATAVVELFEARLGDINDFWGYLNSPEYFSSKTYGLTHEKRYDAYLEEREKIWTYIDLQQELLGGETVEAMTEEEIKAGISDDFVQYSDLSGLKIGDINDVSQRFVEVDAVAGGYAFNAQYDRDNQMVKNVFAYGELASDRLVKIDSLSDLLSNKFADLAEDVIDEEEFDETTYAERIFKRYLAGEMIEVGFVATEFNILVVDSDDAIYRVEDVYMEEHKDILVSFDYVANGEKATNLFMSVGGQHVVLEDEYTLDDLRDLVIAQDKIVNQGKVLR